MRYLVLLIVLTYHIHSVEAKSRGEQSIIGSITLEASSNINTFSFKSFIYQQNLNVSGLDITIDKQLRYYQLRIPVDDFQNPNRRLRSDFFQMINSDSYPHILIDIYTDAKKVTKTSEANESYKLDITLSGVKKSYCIETNASKAKPNKVSFSGQHKINLHDFGLVAPEKIFGLLRVNDTIRVKFNFKLDEK